MNRPGHLSQKSKFFGGHFAFVVEVKGEESWEFKIKNLCVKSVILFLRLSSI